MQTIAAPEVQAQVLTALMDATPARRAQFASYVDDAKAGTLSRVRAFGICRQLRGADAPAMGEDKIVMPRGNGSGAGNHTPDPASEAQMRYVRRLVASKVGGSDYAAEVEKGISKSRASTLIDILGGRKDVEGQEPKATPGQVKFINSLLAEHGQEPMSADLAAQLTPAAASAMIDALKATPRPRTTTATDALNALDLAIYEVDGQVYRVKRSRTTGNHYAQRLVIGERDEDGRIPTEWLRDREVCRTLTAEHKMTLDRAKEYGQLTGVCCRCGTELENDLSISEGIGPVCATKDW